MINDSTPFPPRPSYADAIRQVQARGQADFLLSSGQVAKLNRTKLLQNYEAILQMAGIEQILGESIGMTPGSEKFQIADAALSRYADVPAYWVLPLGELIRRADRQQSVPHEILQRILDLKGARDDVMHGQSENFGPKCRKDIRETYELLLERSRHSPTHALSARIEAVNSAKSSGRDAEEMLMTLGTLFRAIESEVEIRAAMEEAGIFKGKLPLVESIFELKRASGLHQKLFKRDDLAWKFRASALVRNHLVHGTIIVPKARQEEVVDEAHLLLGQTISELRFKKDGGTTATGEFRNGLNF